LDGAGGSLSRLLSSPRRRRRLRTAAALLVVAGGLAFIGIRYSNTADRTKDTFIPGPVQRVAAPPKAARLTSVDSESVRRVAAMFIDTAVLRRRIDDSWAITTRNLRQGLSRQEWDTGNIPVTPFPAEAVDQIKYTVDWTGADFVFLKVAIIPKATAEVAGQAFDIGLARKGAAANHTWLVDYWVPSGLGTRTSAQRRRDAAQAPVERVSTSISQLWIFAPIALMGFMILAVPAAIFGRHRYRAYRAYREYQRQRT